MVLIYILILIGGLGAAAWVFLSAQQENKKPEGPSQAPANLLDRLKIDKDKPQTLAQASQEEKIDQAIADRVETLATVGMPAVEEQEKTEEQEDETPDYAKDPELVAKCETLEKMLNEKTELLEKKEKALANELRAKKEFNKVKDILEKEIRDSKDTIHKLELDLNASKTENTNHLKKIDQYEDKLKSRDADIKLKEKDIDDLKQQIKTAEDAHKQALAAQQEAQKQATDIQPAQEQKQPDSQAAEAQPMQEQKPESEKQEAPGQPAAQKPQEAPQEAAAESQKPAEEKPPEQPAKPTEKTPKAPSESQPAKEKPKEEAKQEPQKEEPKAEPAQEQPAEQKKPEPESEKKDAEPEPEQKDAEPDADKKDKPEPKKMKQEPQGDRPFQQGMIIRQDPREE